MADTRLSSISLLFFALLAGCTVVFGVNDPRLFLVFPLLCLPPVIVLKVLYWNKYREQISLDLVVRMFAAGFVPGAALAMISELLLTIIFALIVYGSAGGKDAQSAMENSQESSPGAGPGGWFGYIVFLILLTFITAGLVEEAVKLAMVRWRCCPAPCNFCHPPAEPVEITQASRMTSARTMLILVTASSLGFSTLETMLYSTASGGGLLASIVIGSLRTATSLPLHTICAMLTAMTSIQDGCVGQGRPSNLVHWVWTLRKAVLVHGTFDLVLFLSPLVGGDTSQLLFALLLDGSVLIGSALYTYRLWKRILRDIGEPATDLPPELPVTMETPSPTIEIELTNIRVDVDGNMHDGTNDVRVDVEARGAPFSPESEHESSRLLHNDEHRSRFQDV